MTLADFVQGMIMIVGSILMVTVLVGKGGGLSNMLSVIGDKFHSMCRIFRLELYNARALVFMTSFGTWGMPQMVQKFYAVKTKTS